MLEPHQRTLRREADLHQIGLHVSQKDKCDLSQEVHALGVLRQATQDPDEGIIHRERVANNRQHLEFSN